MGRQIPRLPRGAGVATDTSSAEHALGQSARPARDAGPSRGAQPPGAESFGAWFARERRLRDISVEFVAARTKLPLEHIRALEGGTAPLGSDGRSRAIARTLARAIGADPEEASARLPEPSPAPAHEGRGRPSAGADSGRPARVLSGGRFPLLALAAALGAIGLGLAAWGVAVWLERPPSAADTPEVIYRPDYLKQLDDPAR